MGGQIWESTRPHAERRTAGCSGRPGRCPALKLAHYSVPVPVGDARTGYTQSRHVCRPDAREARESATKGAARPARGDGGPGGIGSAQRGEAARALDGPPGGYGGARRGRSVPRRGRISGSGSDAWRRSSGGRPVHPRRPCCQDRAKTLVIGVAVAPLRGKITHDGLVRSTDGSSRTHVRMGRRSRTWVLVLYSRAARLDHDQPSIPRPFSGV